MSKKILIVAPHPDDETLGVGGTLLKYQKQGDQLYWLVITTVNSHPGYSKQFQTDRAEQIKTVTNLYSMSDTFELPFLSAELDRYPLSDIIKAIHAVISKLQPDIVYLPFAYDAHSDHRITFEAAFTCTKTFRYPSIKEVLMYETPSETDFSFPGSFTFHPTVFVDVSNTFNQKLSILSEYKSELGSHPFPRSIESINALAQLRGAQSNCHFAESFMLLKRLC